MSIYYLTLYELEIPLNLLVTRCIYRYIFTSTLISFLTWQSKRMVNKIDKMLLLPIRRIKWQEEIKILSSITINMLIDFGVPIEKIFRMIE